MPKSKHLLVVIIGCIILLILSAVLVLRDSSQIVSADKFQKILQTNEINKVYIRGEYFYLESYNKFGDEFFYRVPKSQINPNMPKLAELPIEVKSNITWVFFLVIVFVVVVIVYFIARYILSYQPKVTSPISSMSNSIESRIQPIHSHITFRDVAGIKEAKEELLEIVDFLKNPSKYQKLHITLPKGVLLSGAPGVGKTLIAKALAGESGVPFFYQSGASFVEMYVGVGAKRVRELFSVAKASAPSIIFIDEIDAIGKKRGLESNNNERESTLNQLLMEMDGFSDNSGVIVIGATNHIEALDSALLRSGRFDRRIFIELPNLTERKEMLEMYLRDKPHQIDTQEITQKTSGFSGAMIATLVNEAALCAVRANSKVLRDVDFEAVYSKISHGTRRLPFLDDEAKCVYALYQASKIDYAITHGLSLEKASLFETNIARIDKSNLATINNAKLESHIGFYIVGNEALRGNFGLGYGLFAQDLAESKRLIQLGFECGLFESDERDLSNANDLQSNISTKYMEVKNHLKFYVALHSKQIQQIEKVLLQEEKFEEKSLIDKV
ncbi:AAA family ATPase [Helicobacter fennelliae]|uniref:Cell division protein FtsH n=1 Tax=Helicobacter fennelliae MRY12-0050 TaxID=1325130 RepID=T1DVD6_9HELI|nr:AAA family ATPase [Helicobacter fennelliae]GAD18663.1 cell division protein FtsH [Helicobacter fennelliae MRY12-0050]STP07159.1 ATP-dependent zinc metalloproteinase [Helicobacter fennelliae]